MRKKSDWLGLIFVEGYVGFVFVASVIGFFCAEVPNVDLFLLPLIWWVKIVFVFLVIFCGWFLFWLRKNWFKY